jgi:hypothetical protein
MSVGYYTYTFDKYLILYHPNIKTKKNECVDYYGMTFFIDEFEYHLVHNYHMGNRILINNKRGHNQDIPFKKETFWLLPEQIQVLQIEEKELP